MTRKTGQVQVKRLERELRARPASIDLLSLGAPVRLTGRGERPISDALAQERGEEQGGERPAAPRTRW